MALPSWARGVSALLVRELRRQAGRFAGLALLMQLAMSVMVFWISGTQKPDDLVFSDGWLMVVVVFALWAPTIFSVSALHEEQAPARLDGLRLLGLAPIEVVAAKCALAVILTGLLVLTAAPQLAMVALLGTLTPTASWVVVTAGPVVVAAVPALAAFGVLMSGERLAIVRVAGWGGGLLLSGLEFVLIDQLKRHRAVAEVPWLVSVAFVLAAAAFASATERSGGRPLVLFKRGLGWIALGLWMVTERMDVSPIIAACATLLFALDALTEPLRGRLQGARRALQHPLGAAVYVWLLFVVGAGYALKALNEAPAVVAGQVALLGAALLVCGLSGQLLRRLVHPLIGGVGVCVGLAILAEALAGWAPDILRALDGRETDVTTWGSLVVIGGVAGLVLLKLRLAAWRQAQPPQAAAPVAAPAGAAGAPARTPSAPVGARPAGLPPAQALPPPPGTPPAPAAPVGALSGKSEAPPPGTPSALAAAPGSPARDLSPPVGFSPEPPAAATGPQPGALGLSDPLPERWPAALVKELMILLRGRLFLGVFGAGLLFQLLLLLLVVDGELQAVQTPVEAVVVLMSFTALSAEREDGKLDLLLFNQSPSRLVWGKWAAVALVQLMIFSLGLPALVAAYLLAHANLLSILPAKLVGLLLCWSGSAMALWVSSVEFKPLRFGLMALCGYVIMSTAAVFGEASQDVAGELAADPRRLIWLGLGLLGLGVSITGLLEAAADQLSPLATAAATARKRGLGLLSVAVSIAAGALQSNSEIVVLCALPAVLFAMDAVWDADEPAAGWALLSPGRRCGFSYGLLVAAGVALAAWISKTALFGGLTFAQVLFWVFAPGLAPRLLRLRRYWLPVVTWGLGLGQLLAVAVLIPFVRDEFPNGVLLWPVLMERTLSGAEVAAWLLVLLPSLVIAGGFHFAITAATPRPVSEGAR